MRMFAGVHMWHVFRRWLIDRCQNHPNAQTIKSPGNLVPVSDMPHQLWFSWYLNLYLPEYHPALLHNVVRRMNAATWCRRLSLTFCQTRMQIHCERGTSFCDPTCHSSCSRPASSLSSPAWWSLRSWARRRNSAVACPFQPRSAQSHSGWSAPCASYHCSRHTPGSPLRRDCTLDRRTEGLSQFTSPWIERKRRKRGHIVWVALHATEQHPRVRASIITLASGQVWEVFIVRRQSLQA